MTTYKDIAEMIRSHEGGYAEKVYTDSVGVPTGGWGHAFHIGSRIPLPVATALFDMDFRTAIDDYNSFNLDLCENRKAVIVDMLFNLGIVRFKTFKKLIVRIHARDFSGAADEMVDSKWYGQVGKRAQMLVKMMREDRSYKSIMEV